MSLERKLKTDPSFLDTGLCRKCQLQSQLLATKSWERTAPLHSPGLCHPNPHLLGHPEHNASKTDLIPHLSVDSTGGYMDE